jgi:hypothetical protein
MKKGRASKFAGRTTSFFIATCPRASTEKFYLSTPDTMNNQKLTFLNAREIHVY